MIKHLEYSVTFPSTGKTLSGSFALGQGITAVTGPNWSGKTFGSIEIVRYMLFGKKALRGPAPDYKNLTGVMTCEIAGVDYQIERTAKKETVTRLADDEVLAVNTEAVNQKLVEILGFGLDIFDFICAAPQGQVQKLSELKPAQRKQLIDRLLRLQPQEMVEKACKDKAKDHRLVANTLASTLVSPEEPPLPPGYQPSEAVQHRIASAKALASRRAALTLTRKDPPVQPEGAWEDVTELGLEVEAWRDLRHQRKQLEDQIQEHIFRVIFSEEVLAEAEQYLDYQIERERRGPEPTLTLEDIQNAEQAWAMLKFGETEVTCPECSCHFAPGEDVEQPGATREFLNLQRQAHANWVAPLPFLAPPEVSLTRREIEAQRHQRLEDARVAGLVAELSELPELGPDPTPVFRHRLAINSRWEAYEQQLVLTDEHNARVDEAEAELALLPVEREDIDALYEQLSEAKLYEAEVSRYLGQHEAYQSAKARHAGEVQLAEDFAGGATAIGKARATVKAHLAPSLSRVASTLMSTMTGGQFTSVLVNEDMEIMVDHQDINTLSGAGKTIANLALRIALGQVLTSRVFPVFIGDEIDSDMDAANAQATAEALVSLSSQLKQIILVTHKQVEIADHHIVHPVTGGLVPK